MFTLNKKDNTIYSTKGKGVIFNFDKITSSGNDYVFYYYGHYIGFVSKSQVDTIKE